MKGTLTWVKVARFSRAILIFTIFEGGCRPHFFCNVSGFIFSLKYHKSCIRKKKFIALSQTDAKKWVAEIEG